MDLKEGVVAIGLAREQRLDLAPHDLGPKRRQRGFGFGHHFAVALLLAKLDEPRGVVQPGIEL